MLDPQLLRNDPARVAAALARRGFELQIGSKRRRKKDRAGARGKKKGD